MIMPADLRLYTPAEAAAVNDMGVKVVHNAIDKKIVEPAPRSAKGSERMLTADDLLRLKLWHGVGSVLSAERRKRLFEAIAAKPAARTVKADDLLIIDVAAARRQVAAGVKDLQEAEAAIHRVKAVMGGDPVFKGTRIPVRLVAAMLDQGAEAAEILDGYPKLNPRLLELARVWVAAHPARGRPKTLSEQGLKQKSVTRVPLSDDPLHSSNRKAGAAA
jgi:uncharacterized protein (DUF433 family)